jgi:NADPH:quinone reductase-like Zn-dependent oxidoreductase
VEAGDEVVIYPGLPCGCCEHCVRGEHSQCESFGIVGATRPGTYAEKVTVPAANVRPRPQNLSFAEAAALPVAYLTAWRMLMHRACLEPGETVLIHGIGGGVALAGLQICDLLGAEAIVTSSSHEKLQRAADMGAKHTINYLETEDVAEVVMGITGGRGVDVALDSVGAQTWGINLRAVRRGGRVVICGVTTGPTAETDLQALYWNQISLLGSTLGSLDEFRQLLRTVETGDLKPLLDSVHSLEQAPQAMEKMEKGEQMGKIVLDLTA